jgi:hypothetical protein
MEKLDMVKKSFAMKPNIHQDFFANSEATISSDALMVDILTSEFDCTESIVRALYVVQFSLSSFSLHWLQRPERGFCE